MSAVHLGFFNTSGSRTHVGFQFSTHVAAGGNVAPSSALEAADIRIYRAADSAAYSATQRSSANGITMTSPFDTLVGFHDVDINLTDNTDAGFYASGYRYAVVLAPDETVDTQTITGMVLAYFEIGMETAADIATAVWASGTRTLTSVVQIKKGVAFPKFMFLMTDSTNHNPATGKTVTATISKDGGAFAALNSGDTVTEVANGIYEVDLNATDTNANNFVLRLTATACDELFERVITST